MALLQYLLQHPQILIVIIFVAGPVLRGIFERLKTQAQERQAEIARERARIDALRTGGRTDDESPSAGVALERRAAERRGMTGGMASRQADRVENRDGPTRGPTRGQTPGQAPASASKKRREGTERRGPRIPGQSPTTSTQSPRGARGRSEAIETADPRIALPPRRQEPTAGPSALQRDAATRDEAAMAAAGVALAASAQSKAAWRRAILMQEVLMPPVSMR